MDRVRQAYGAKAEQYIELFGTGAYMHTDDVDLITQHLSIQPGNVLDVGCGPGHLTERLRLLGVNVTGIDIVPEFITHARKTFPDSRYELGSMEQLPVPSGSIAGILAWYSLIHLTPADVDGVLVELRRAMATGGALVLGFFSSDELAAFKHGVVQAYYWPVNGLSDRLQRAGFTVVDRQLRAGVDEPGHRPEAAIVAIAT
jgi:ubiquinone/menaquinone biosynthesis C-methylase UbiE